MNVLWAIGYPAAAFALAHGISPALLSLVRLGAAFLLLAPVLRRIRIWTWKLLGFGAWMGVVGFSLPVWLQSWGIHRTNPGIAALSIAVEPLFTIMAAALLRRQRVSRWQLAAFALALVGSWILTGAPRPGRAPQLGGDIALFAAVLCFALFNIYSPTLFERTGAAPGSALVFGFGALGSLVLWLGSDQSLPTVHAPMVWLALIYLTVGATAIAYYLWLAALGHETLVTATLLLYTQPLLGTFIAWALGQTRMTWALAVGGLLVLAAMTLGQQSGPGPNQVL